VNRPKSKEIYDKMCQVIPGGVNSPVRAFYSMGMAPMVIDRGNKDMIYDADGHSYIDFCGSWGSLIHGHAHPSINEGIQSRLSKGLSFGITTAVEGELAAEIVKLIDSVEKIRFVSSGTEATMSAARLARGFTKKDYIIKFTGNYHGHADFFLVQAGSSLIEMCPSASSSGIPAEIVKYTISLPYNDIEACKAVFNHPAYADRIAAVILEPVAGNMGVVPATDEFIKFLSDETKKHGALLIFDEVITGFRVGLKGAQGIYKVKPDLTCFGKIIGGGLPVAAFGGRSDVMDCLAPLGAVFQAGTLSGNPIAMEAGLQSIKLVQKTGFYEDLQRKTDSFVQPIKDNIKQKKWNACIQQVGSMFTLFFGSKKVNNLEDAVAGDTRLYAQLFRALFNQGIYIPPSAHETWFISSVHEEKNLVKSRDAILTFMDENCG